MSEQEERLVQPEEPAPPAEVLPPLSIAEPGPPAGEAPALDQQAVEPGPPAGEAPALDQQAVEAETFQRPRSLKDLKPGMVLEGKVTSVAIYGVFVDVGVGREGLVHVSQLSDRPVSSPTEVVQIGDMVTVRVLEVDPRSKRINLTMRERVEAEIDQEKLAALIPGSVVEGTVASLTRFGAFVDLGVGKDGLIPLAQLKSAAEQGGEAVSVGQAVRVRIVDVDKKSGRIRLSMRNIYDPDQLSALQPGSLVRGRITSLAPFGAFVDLGVGKDGLIHVSTMGEGDIRHPKDVVQVGQEVEVRVVDVNPETQRISLSMQLEDEEEEAWVPEPEPLEEEPAEPERPATLADLAARFGKLRDEARGQPPRPTTRAEKEKRAVQDALRRTLEGSREEKK